MSTTTTVIIVTLITVTTVLIYHRDCYCTFIQSEDFLERKETLNL